MEYVLINDSKLKIMLEARELAEWDMTVEELDYSNPAAKRVFEGLLGYAKEQFGFDTSGHKILLQLYPSKDGGCEIFVSLLGESSDKKAADVSEKGPHVLQIAYSFDRLSHLLSVCKRLCHGGFSGKSSAWLDGDGKWFLLLSVPDESADDLSFISEYGHTESLKALSLYLCEYASMIREDDAAMILGKI